ncbi:hypothetical protein ABIE89_002127 [Bradyrhizobium niftali]|uniref:hypothetical protein n=1 Tax=Bradyrhizobium niftali TaxID=2560055 RepID=UPI0038355893
MRARGTLACCVALGGFLLSGTSATAISAKAVEDLLRILPDAKEMYEALPGLLANDLPGLVSEDGELQERLVSAKKFHAEHRFQQLEPKLDGARVFSEDAGAREDMRNEYARYVEAEKRDLDLLKSRRDYQAGRLAEYQRLYQRNANYANQAPDLIDRAGKAGTGGEQLAQELASVLATAEDAKLVADEIIHEYERILGEYDSRIRLQEAEHAVHSSNLKILKVIQPRTKFDGSSSGSIAPQQPGKPGPTGAGSQLGEGVRSAVTGSIDTVRASASSVQAQLWQTQRQIGPYRPSFSQTQTSAGNSDSGLHYGYGGGGGGGSSSNGGGSGDGYWRLWTDGRAK